jgi:hypothetical protein
LKQRIYRGFAAKEVNDKPMWENAVNGSLRALA